MTPSSQRQRRVFCAPLAVALVYAILFSRWGISNDDDNNNNKKKKQKEKKKDWNPNKPTQEEQQYIRLHSLDHAIVDLMEWEINSTVSCRRPSDVPNYCCISGRFGNLCDHVTVDQQHQIRDDAARVLHSLPLSNTTTNSTIQCDICQIVEIAKDQQLHIAFLGDSVEQDTVERLVCNLARRNYRVNRTIVKDTRQRNAEFHYTIWSPLWQNKNQVVEFRVWRQFRTAVNVPEIIENIDEFEQIYNWPDVLIIGFGLHYQYNTSWGKESKQAFLEKTARFINSKHRNQSWFQNNKKRPAVWMIREPSMQHFAPAGDYSYRGDHDLTCLPYLESQQYLKDNNLSL